MFNVLPDTYKNEIKKEYRIRRWIIVFCGVIFLITSFLVFLFPTWINTLYHYSGIKRDIEAQKAFVASKNTHNIFNIIDSTNEKISIIKSDFQYSHPVPLLDKIVGMRNSNILIKSITFQNTGTSTTAVSLEGVAHTRESLVSFVKKLQQVPSFRNIVSPVSDLAQYSNITFSITLNSQ